jgi:Amt family ammonium transporter
MKMFEKFKLDDPIAALSVHGTAGILGTLANGFFATPELAEKLATGKAGLFYGGGFDQLIVQAESVLLAGGYAFVLSFVFLFIIKKTVGLRVTEEQEIIGLDLSEHGTYGYPEQMKKASN